MTDFKRTINLIQPVDWKKFHSDNVATLNPELRGKAVEFLKEQLAPESNPIKAEIVADPQTWWAKHHFFGGIAIRNILRKNGFGEKEFGIENLDDYYVGLVELALQ